MAELLAVYWAGALAVMRVVGMVAMSDVLSAAQLVVYWAGN